jgi:poly(3-hydroxybutyrate) depolymerase
MMYQAYQAHADLMWPLRTAAKMSAPMLLDPAFGLGAQPSPARAGPLPPAACSSSPK